MWNVHMVQINLRTIPKGWEHFYYIQKLRMTFFPDLFVPNHRVESATKEAYTLQSVEITSLDLQWLQVSYIWWFLLIYTLQRVEITSLDLNWLQVSYIWFFILIFTLQSVEITSLELHYIVKSELHLVVFFIDIHPPKH